MRSPLFCQEKAEEKRMNRYTIARTDGGNIPAGVTVLSLDHILWEPDCGVRAGGTIRHDGEHLFVTLNAKEKNIRAEYLTAPSPVHEDSCLEFFFMPAEEERYLNFEVNPNGCLHLGFGRNREERETILLPDAVSFFGIRTGRTPDGWEVSCRIPGEFLRRYYPGFRFAGALRANVYKCGDRTVRPHYLAWNNVDAAAPDFHRPECFGEMVFG